MCLSAESHSTFSWTTISA